MAARLGEMHVLPLTRTLLTFVGVPPHSDRAAHNDLEKGLWSWQSPTDIARRFRWVKPHMIRFHHLSPPDLNLTLVELHRCEQPSLSVLL